MEDWKKDKLGEIIIEMLYLSSDIDGGNPSNHLEDDEKIWWLLRAAAYSLDQLLQRVKATDCENENVKIH